MITPKEIIELENKAEAKGTSKLELMERAGKGLYEVIMRKYNPKTVLIFASHGNNGGDGFVAARYFDNAKVLFLGQKEKLTKESRSNFEKIKEKLTKEVREADVIIDAMLGTGVEGEIREPISTAIDLFNSISGAKVAVDIPTGLDPLTGEKKEKFCDVDLIVTFHDLKTGLQGLEEKTEIVDIGLGL